MVDTDSKYEELSRVDRYEIGRQEMEGNIQRQVILINSLTKRADYYKRLWNTACLQEAVKVAQARKSGWETAKKAATDRINVLYQEGWIDHAVTSRVVKAICALTHQEEN